MKILAIIMFVFCAGLTASFADGGVLVFDTSPDSRFIMPAEGPVDPGPDPAIVEYIAGINGNIDAEVPARYICDAAREQELDPWLLVAVARYESTYRTWCRGDAGERGLLQVHPCHRYRFDDYGCDWDSEYDVVRFGAAMMRENLDKGYSLKRSLRPWTVRPKALWLYGTFELATGTGRAPVVLTNNQHPDEPAPCASS